ncbi:hypothetical protein BSZ35_00195 [Salinibacter sp. 10B]|uniref:hypothetical protein n=1 Tax=Salinibacter sp. 10B TaxID=1923971 RepID=UPI000CF4FB1D|nr:hypothetical protein [Salinibacter sp. 10B]PQJ36809.1 hypothetical protein BSZ35_00195 [Salinibacter sp. 10B]
MSDNYSTDSSVPTYAAVAAIGILFVVMMVAVLGPFTSHPHSDCSLMTEAMARSALRKEIESQAVEDGNEIARYGQEITHREGNGYRIRGYADVALGSGGRQRISYRATVGPNENGCPSLEGLSVRAVTGVR